MVPLCCPLASPASLLLLCVEPTQQPSPASVVAAAPRCLAVDWTERKTAHTPSSLLDRKKEPEKPEPYRTPRALAASAVLTDLSTGYKGKIQVGGKDTSGVKGMVP